MRKRLSSLAYLLLALPLGGMAVVSACGGGDTTTNDGGTDATVDVKPDVVKLDAAPDVVEASCANDADLTQYLPSADASIDVDAGGLDISACTGCLKTSCGTNINACNQDCNCRQGVIDFVTCIAAQTSITTCATNALTSGNTNLQALIGCASSNCLSSCIPGDGGTQDAGSDGAADAASD